MIKIKLISLFLCFSLLFSLGSFALTEEILPEENNVTEAETEEDLPLVAPVKDDMFSSRDLKTNYSKTATISFSGSSIQADDSSVLVDGCTVTITAEGVFLITGTSDCAQIVVNAPSDAKVQLVLDGADLSNNDSAVIYVMEADKVFITSAKKSENTISSLGELIVSEEEESTTEVTDTAAEETAEEKEVVLDAPIFSECDITFNGLGVLNVVSEIGHGIVGKDDLKIASGTINVTAAKKGIDANDSIRIADGTITVNAGTDALHCENLNNPEKGFVCIFDGELNLTTVEGDAIDASNQVSILGGSINAITAGGSAAAPVKSDGFGFGPGGFGGWGSNEAEEDTVSYKGIKSDISILFEDGTVTLDTYDDAVHTAGDIEVNGGTLTISSGDDGIHADDILTVNGGTIHILTCYEGLEAYVVTINDGYIELLSTDDGFNANGPEGGFGGFGSGEASSETTKQTGITINDGYIYINAEGDGIDSNGYLYVNGGETYVDGPIYTQNGALDSGSTCEAVGGTLIGVSTSNMAEGFRTATQGTINYGISTTGKDGEAIILTDSKGNEIIHYLPQKSGYSLIVITSPDIQIGETYTLSVGENSYTISMTESLFSQGGMGMGGPGGGPGGRPGGQPF